MSAGAPAIEQFFRRRFGRDALFLPSGRFGLYLALREWLRPGDRVLMSPVNCDVVFFTLLAAGLVPVFGPVDPSTGNLDPDAVDDTTWSSLRAIVTTNLYGIADRMDRLVEQSRRHRLVMIEDACHAIDSRFEGQRIGTFGTAAVYSLGKHVGGAGGIVTVKDASRREALARRAAGELRHWSLLRRSVARLRDRVAPNRIERAGHRLVYDRGEVVQAQLQGAGIDRFEKWLGADKGDYRTPPERSSLRTTVERLETLDENCRLRIAGARRLLDLGYMPAGVRIPADSALFRVPLFVQERDGMIGRCAARQLAIDYVYDPPLDLYAGPLGQAMPSPSAARRWSRDVLPVDPLEADRFLEVVRESPALGPARDGLAAVATCQ